MKQLIKGIKRDFEWMSVFTGPFKRPRLKWYFGKIALGTPYFYPRRWVKSKDKPGHTIATPKKIGFDFVPMRWKTKWGADDYRFESGPIWSFVFFKWQMALTFPVEEMNHYWECWLYYTYETDKTKSVEERIQKSREGFPCIWTTSRGEGKKETVCYWDKILKEKYI